MYRANPSSIAAAMSSLFCSITSALASNKANKLFFLAANPAPCFAAASSSSLINSKSYKVVLIKLIVSSGAELNPADLKSLVTPPNEG